ncbi:MAG: prolipoprotein diacylglyceryl transferase [Magnetococcus sp. WYHC-3]
MIPYPDIDPILVQLGPLTVRWYGLMYALSFLLGWPLLRRRAARVMPQVSRQSLEDMTLWLLVGLVLGGRLGYVLFYNLPYYLENPLGMVMVWQGGMSFHGGFLGGLAACVIYARRHHMTCLALADLFMPLVPLGLFLGRIGNFINGELWGRATDLPWGMVFPGAGSQPRHPSQLYEAFLEGVVLFAVLHWYARRPRPAGTVLGVFLIGYGLCRFTVEFVREPDAHLGLLGLGLSMGQWLSLPMVLLGAGLWWWRGRAAGSLPPGDGVA